MGSIRLDTIDSRQRLSCKMDLFDCWDVLDRRFANTHTHTYVRSKCRILSNLDISHHLVTQDIIVLFQWPDAVLTN